MPGGKVVIGDGPALKSLEQRFPAAHFLGAMHGADLASAYATAHVLVFPSRTDTFGLVMIEALASGTPVAGYPVRGPLDIIGTMGRGLSGHSARIGALDDNLSLAIRAALGASRGLRAGSSALRLGELHRPGLLAGLCPGHLETDPSQAPAVSLPFSERLTAKFI